tara:strand:+ start:2098 stop:2331 length:234 start_codon:yes stop_codon:yes gene_type:complete
MDADLDKSIARMIDVSARETILKLDDESHKKVTDAIIRLDIPQGYVPTRELPVKFLRHVADAIKIKIKMTNLRMTAT